MRAMILAAGRGERMGMLTANTPKPLLRVGEFYLIEHALYHLKHANIHEIVINVAYQAEQIKTVLGNGQRYGVNIVYSEEVERLETGGGILKALPLLGDQAFLVVSSDIITSFPIQSLPQNPQGLAHLVMARNPVYHPQGDFGLYQDKINFTSLPKFTFANIGIYRPELFANCQPGHFRLSQVLTPAILNEQITGELYQGRWFNIGTPDDLKVFSECN